MWKHPKADLNLFEHKHFRTILTLRPKLRVGRSDEIEMKDRQTDRLDLLYEQGLKARATKIEIIHNFPMRTFHPQTFSRLLNWGKPLFHIIPRMSTRVFFFVQTTNLKGVAPILKGGKFFLIKKVLIIAFASLWGRDERKVRGASCNWFKQSKVGIGRKEEKHNRCDSNLQHLLNDIQYFIFFIQLTKRSDRKSVSKNIYQGFAEITIALRHHVSRQNLTRLSVCLTSINWGNWF
jgi:hypothetical protein